MFNGAKNTSQLIFVTLFPLKHLFFFSFPSTVSSILGAWLDQYSEDFWSPPNYDCLHQLLSYLHRHFLGSDLERRARNLLAHFLRRQQCEPDPDGMKAGQERDTRAGTPEQQRSQTRWGKLNFLLTLNSLICLM